MAVCGRVMGLVLFGEAPSFHVKQLAQHAVGQLTQLPISPCAICETAWVFEPYRQAKLQCALDRRDLSVGSLRSVRYPAQIERG
jgi:hypothetical protein